MNELDKHLEQMDKDGKVGWNEEGFEQLNFEDKVAVSTAKFLGQIYNGGIEQFITNNYGFYLPFLKQDVASYIEMPELREYVQKIQNILIDGEKLYYKGDEYIDTSIVNKLDKLDVQLYNGLGNKIKKKICTKLSE